MTAGLPGGGDLADKELAQLIAEVAERKPHVAVVPDACHSGSGTRAPADTSVRRVPTAQRVRRAEDYVVTPAQAAANQREVGSAGGETGWFTLPAGAHVVLSACRAEEEAKEQVIEGERRGVFSHFLLEALQQAGQSLSYRDLAHRVAARVRATTARQVPQIEATAAADLDRPFLGGAVSTQGTSFHVRHDAQRGWVIDAGEVHGIPTPRGGETVVLALFPFAHSSGGALADALGTAKVTRVWPGESTVDVTLRDGTQPARDQTFKAVVAALPVPPTRVALEGDPEGVKLLQATLALAGPEASASLFVEDAAGAAGAELRVEARADGFRIRRTADTYPLTVDVQGIGPAEAELVVARLEHIARWMRIAALENPQSSIAPDAVRMELYREHEDTPLGGSEIRLEYSGGAGPRFRVRLKNTSGKRLYCMLLDLTETYEVDTAGLLPGGGVWLEPHGQDGAEAWARGGASVDAWIPNTLAEQGVVELRDILKLIVSTEESNATLLEQPELPVGVLRSAPRDLPLPKGTLERLMQRVGARAIGQNPEAAEALVDWRTSEVVLTTVRPREAVPVPRPEVVAELGAGVTLLGHPSFRAGARLTREAPATRDLGNLALPALLRDDIAVSQPFSFGSARGGEPGLGVVELVDADGFETVTPEQPLVFRADVVLGDDEHLLPVAFDGEFFLPLGRALRRGGGVEITLERLPAPTQEGRRSLTGSIRILFRKIVGQKLGLPFDYPHMAVAEVDDRGVVVYDAALDVVRARVAAAQRIVLYIHGIIGDTRGMVASVRGLPHAGVDPSAALAGRYDLVLSFDYENLHTSIEDTARALKERLAAVGLGPDHGRTLHIVAHLMGCLVSRWFIEREGGNRVVQHLVMLGAPNAGSPWPSVQHWATVALGLALNGLAAVVWPVQALGALMGGIEAVDAALDEMQPDSVFLRSLNSSPDPGIPYTVLAGNTSVIARALESSAAAERGLLTRLLQRLSPQPLVHGVTSLAFFGQPNDIAVSVQSICAVPPGRSPSATVREIACDHISYFSTAAGLKAVAEALS